MSDNDLHTTAQQKPQFPKMIVLLVGRQSYDLTSNEYKLIPNINVLAKASSTQVIEAWELYQHFLELSEILNEGISEVVDAYNEDIEDDSNDDEDVIETGDINNINFAKVFDPEENEFLIAIANNIAEGGYSQTTVYMQFQYDDTEIVTFQPETIQELSNKF